MLGLIERPRARRQGSHAGDAAEVSLSPTSLTVAVLPSPFHQTKTPHARPDPAFAQLYLPKFLDRAEQTGGREWDAIRTARVWRLSLRYFRMKQVREVPLDPATQYIINYHPHGVLVLSRVFYYGEPMHLARSIGQPAPNSWRLLRRRSAPRDGSAIAPRAALPEYACLRVRVVNAPRRDAARRRGLREAFPGCEVPRPGSDGAGHTLSLLLPSRL